MTYVVPPAARIAVDLELAHLVSAPASRGPAALRRWSRKLHAASPQAWLATGLGCALSALTEAEAEPPSAAARSHERALRVLLGFDPDGPTHLGWRRRSFTPLRSLRAWDDERSRVADGARALDALVAQCDPRREALGVVFPARSAERRRALLDGLAARGAHAVAARLRCGWVVVLVAPGPNPWGVGNVLGRMDCGGTVDLTAWRATLEAWFDDPFVRLLPHLGWSDLATTAQRSLAVLGPQIGALSGLDGAVECSAGEGSR